MTTLYLMCRSLYRHRAEALAFVRTALQQLGEANA